MNDRQEKNSDFIEIEKGYPVVLHKIPSHHSLVKANRLLLGAICLLMVIIFVMGFWLVPDKSLVIANYAKINSSDIAANMNPVISAEVNALKGQFVGLVSGSIESKLKVLEESVRSGKLNSSLSTIEDLKNDVQVLRGYVKPLPSERLVLSNERLIDEMSHLKRLVYMTLASCALMFAAFVGVWYKTRHRLSYRKPKQEFLNNR
ncbi:MAG: hypothetical protein WC782_05370 [Methylococcaceae bacterium]|jgi:hypothetical protein